ncbi:4-hydroxybenzoate octaprenyltransferase [Gammaproteobacteria bacterium]|nr:4-hydroxybenzoate octaprenyltransferase [Gammaproteobacteria bacterium]MDB4244418.1 4-hydroxybenzoate octaprenyltransferase [Gammaproteobacteria bacterium]MDC1189932.1 4-hydroxybenzoate octaprenyltransferase [Gammaproteobacteria bacterium]
MDKPIGIFLLLWPSFLGLLLAGLETSIEFKNILIVIVGSVLVRSCGCVINDISDFKFDRLVKRTAKRPIATGDVSLLEAWLFFIFLSFLSLSLLFLTPSLTLKISALCALLIAIYPMAKRFIKAPQFVLGITFGSGVVISYSLQSDIFSLSLLILYLGVVAWIISFDTFYALEDIEDDKKIGVNSSAILWGSNAITIAKYLHYIFYASLALVAYINEFSLFFIPVMIVLVAMQHYQMNLVADKKYLDSFKFNNWIGIVSVIGFISEVYIF